jgi:hypothetical protein
MQIQAAVVGCKIIRQLESHEELIYVIEPHNRWMDAAVNQSKKIHEADSDEKPIRVNS